MILWTKLSHPVERCNEVSCDDTGRRPVGSVGFSRVWKSNTILIGWNNGDLYPRYLVCVPLKEGREERIVQHVIHGLEHRPYVWGGALHEIPILMEGLFQARIGGLHVLARHSVRDFHKILPPLQPLLQPPSLSRIHPQVFLKIPTSCYDMQDIPPEQGLYSRYVPWRQGQDALSQIG